MPHREGEVDAKEINGDNQYSIEELIFLLKEEQTRSGKFSLIRFDAGANNVEVMIQPRTRRQQRNEDAP